ncbi:MAG: hypothetical protein A2888_03045 [Chlamydiae bacterium RIFCSPLOWO2_01_FULL_28_7]|nr:MAG: hypothetical protein A2888_03045 [Chlamydiae bacterium RIFCSPLOWO2_01_FULL_28_7]
MKKIILTLSLLSSFVFSNEINESSNAYYSITRNSFENQNWVDVINRSKFIIKNYPDSPFIKDILFYAAVSYYNVEDLELSNKYFTRYLKGDFAPAYFEEVIQYKYSIAEKFKNGSRKRAFGWKKGPKLIDSEEDALFIFDEVIASMPNHELACKSMFSKAQIKLSYHEYKEAVEIYQNLIKRFPRDDLAIQSFVEIAKTFRIQTTYKQQNFDILELAKLNLSKLKENYSYEEEKILEVENILSEMNEIFAKGLLDTANFYENSKKIPACKMYYTKVIKNFPNTKSANAAKEKLNKLESVS